MYSEMMAYAIGGVFLLNGLLLGAICTAMWSRRQSGREWI